MAENMGSLFNMISELNVFTSVCAITYMLILD